MNQFLSGWLQWSYLPPSDTRMRVNIEESGPTLHYVGPPPRSLAFENPSFTEYAVHC